MQISLRDLYPSRRSELDGGILTSQRLLNQICGARMNMTSVPLQDEKAFYALLSELNLDRSLFKVELTEHSPPTYGPTVSTVEIVWNGRLTIQYGAAAPSHWVTQFRADWTSGLIPETMSELAN